MEQYNANQTVSFDQGTQGQEYYNQNVYDYYQGIQQKPFETAAETVPHAFQQTQSAAVEDELGFGNSSLPSRPVSTRPDNSNNPVSTSEQQSVVDDSKPKISQGTLSALWSSAASIFGKRPSTASKTESSAVTAKLGEENSFVYDNELKRWVNKKDVGSSSTTGAQSSTPAPPQMSAPPMAPPSTPMALSAQVSRTTSPMPPMGDGINQLQPARSGTLRRNARSRYVDTLNPGSSNDSSSSIQNPQPQGGPVPRIMSPANSNRGYQ
jgi:hypothetical protein